MTAAPIVGGIGDLLTFAGGFLLAWDVVKAEQEFQRAKKIAVALRSPLLQNLKVEVQGIIIHSDDDVERAFLRRSAKKGVLGVIILAVGFGCLLAARVLELFTQLNQPLTGNHVGF